ncbi:MAG: hypothetical protein V4582_06995 [Pseudomonadota bacterium]
MKFPALLALCLASPAFANGLDDIKNAITPLQGQGVLHGVYEAKQQKTDLESKTAKGPDSASAAAQVDEDATGLQIRWDRALLKRAADDANPSKGAKKAEALLGLIGSSSAPRVAQAVNYAPKFLESLAYSQLVSERADTYQGKPARLVELNITPPDDNNDKVKVKENKHVAHVWLSADGTPLAATVNHSIKASFMVFMSYEKSSKEEFTFAVLANRLVVLKREDQGTEKGFGNSSQYRNSYTFTPKA